MEPNNSEIEEKKAETITPIIEEFPERIKEEVEDGYIDDRGFYTTPNGSFWDENETYFNHIGFDKHGGRYDEYGVYQPGPNYNFEFNCYEDEIDKKNNKCFEQINENTKKTLVECYESNNQCIEEFNRIHQNIEEGDYDGEENNCEYNDEEMKKIYNECIDIVNQSKTKCVDNANQSNNEYIDIAEQSNNDEKKNNENDIKKDNDEKVEINGKENEIEKENEVEEKVTYIPNILLVSKNKNEERKNAINNENTQENQIKENDL